MEGEGRAPKPTGPQQPNPHAGAPGAPPDASPSVTRGSFVSVDLEDVEVVPPSVEEIAPDDIDIDFEEGAPAGSVEKLLAMTGEGWSIEDQRESLKEAAKDKLSEPADDHANARPSLSIPTPYDFGAADLVTEQAATATPAARPPPLPGAGSPAQRPSVPPPPPPARDRSDDTGGSIRPPPLPGSRVPATTAKGLGPAELASVRPPPPPSPASGPPAALPSRRPPPPPVEREPARMSKGAPLAPPPPSHEGSALVDLLSARVERLESSDDVVGLARAHVELAIVSETVGDDGRVNASAEAALKVDPDLRLRPRHPAAAPALARPARADAAPPRARDCRRVERVRGRRAPRREGAPPRGRRPLGRRA